PALPNDPTTLRPTLLTRGASYALLTNGSIDSVPAAAGVSNVRREVHTAQDGGLPDPVGDGHVGAVALPAASTLTVGSRGDFGGVSADASSRAAELDFDNLAGPIQGLGHLDLLQASGTVSDVRVAGGIDTLEGYALHNITFETDPGAPATVANVLVGPGGSQGLAFGNQTARTIQLDAQDQITGITEVDGTVYALTYQADGTPGTLQKG